MSSPHFIYYKFIIANVVVRIFAQVRYAAVRFDEHVGQKRLREHRIRLLDLARNAIRYDDTGHSRAPMLAEVCDFMEQVGCSCVIVDEYCKRIV